MKITGIKIENFIGSVNVDLCLTRPIALICGHNHSGKSSIAEAVRMALTGDPSRVSLKKDYPRLITTGQTVGYAVVDNAGGSRSAITLPNGAHEHTGERPPAILPYVLDAQRFSSLPANERRSFLFGLMGLRTDGDAVTQRLLAKGCDHEMVKAITPHLRAGFDAAHKEAQAKAREAKASWRAVTGETYGSIKAASWSAPKPGFVPEKLKALRADDEKLAQQIDDGVRDVGTMHGLAKAQADQGARLAGMRERAGKFARIEAKLRHDEGALKELQAKVDAEMSKGGKQLPAEPTYTCPACSVILRHDHANGALVEFTPPPVVDSPTDPGKLAEYQRARDLLARSVANDKRDLADADAAANALAEIDDSKASPAPTAEEIAAAREKVASAKKARADLQETIKALEDDERSTLISDHNTGIAHTYHAKVIKWDAVADALAPNGIPGDMLSKALGPINQRLASSSHMTEWLRVGIDADMAVTGNGRPYSLLSESERWRSDAMIAEAISHLSGCK
ncbi:MAG TPA: ATP-binding protein, partial [Candidatus Accumulibacter phosphatis]|nr:ATP-binding protein [Candidatus Accumulibacter phosphatis]